MVHKHIVCVFYISLFVSQGIRFIPHWNLGINYVVCVEVGYAIRPFQEVNQLGRLS